MNEDTEAKVVSETLSDGSKAWNVVISTVDGGAVVLYAVSEDAAHRLAGRLNDLFVEGGAA